MQLELFLSHDSCRIAERKAARLRKVRGAVEGASAGTPASVDHLWRIARQGRRQVSLRRFGLNLYVHIRVECVFFFKWKVDRWTSSPQHLKQTGDPLSRRNASHFPLELPKLNVVVPTPKVPYPVSTFPGLTISHRASLPAISKKCQSRLTKVSIWQSSVQFRFI